MYETRFYIRILGGKKVIVLCLVNVLYILSLKNYTLITIIKAMSINGKVTLLILIILIKVYMEL
jgi:hypothetical protein